MEQLGQLTMGMRAVFARELESLQADVVAPLTERVNALEAASPRAEVVHGRGDELREAMHGLEQLEDGPFEPTEVASEPPEQVGA